MGKKQKISNTKEKRIEKNAYEKICEEEERLSKLIFGDITSVLNTKDDATEAGPSSIETEENSHCAWEDEDDYKITVGVALKAQGRNLPDGGENSKANKYSKLLKNKYQNLIGTPKWAKVTDNQNETDSDEEVLQSCGFIASSTENVLRKGVLEIKKLKDLNNETYSEGPIISSIDFHPTSTVGLVAGSSTVFSLFAVDGKRNSKLHSVKLHKFPINCAKFNRGGSEIVLGSAKYGYYYTYDLEKAEAQRLFLPQNVTNMQKFEISPCGRYIAIAGRFGDVFLLDAKNKEKLSTFRQNSKVRSLAFTPDGSSLYAHSEEGKVTVWDLTMQRVINTWYDDGCIQGSSIDISPCGKFVATGSFEGVVNLYERDSLIIENPKPSKAILNLTTCITNLKFNPTSEILTFSSVEKANAIKLLHISSQTVFSNFPKSDIDIHKVNSIAFSPASGYMAIGNNKSTVSLYRLKHYFAY